MPEDCEGSFGAGEGFEGFGEDDGGGNFMGGGEGFVGRGYDGVVCEAVWGT